MPRAQPRLADLSCKQIRFRPGDRVIVRCHHKLDQNSHLRLRRAVQKWAGEDVEVLIYNPKEMDITIEQYN